MQANGVGHAVDPRELTRTDVAARISRRDRQHRHHLHGFARKDREMRMLLEHLGSRLMRIRAHDREGAQLVAHIFDAFVADPLRLAERPAHGDERALVLFDPGLPGGDALLFLGSSVRPREAPSTPSCGAGLAAEKNGEICVVRSHGFSFPLLCARSGGIHSSPSPAPNGARVGSARIRRPYTGRWSAGTERRCRPIRSA